MEPDGCGNREKMKMTTASKTPVFSSVKEMFDAIRGEDGVLRPTQFVPNGQEPIRLAGLPAEPQNSPRTSTTPAHDK